MQEARACWEEALRLFSVKDDLALLERLLTLLEGRSEREHPSAALPAAAAAPVEAPSSSHDTHPGPATSFPGPKAGSCCSSCLMLPDALRAVMGPFKSGMHTCCMGVLCSCHECNQLPSMHWGLEKAYICSKQCVQMCLNRPCMQS